MHRDIAGAIWPDLRRTGRHRSTRICDEWQRFVVYLNQFSCIRGLVCCLRHHYGHRLTQIAHGDGRHQRMIRHRHVKIIDQTQHHVRWPLPLDIVRNEAQFIGCHVCAG
jgi:hypothetical protein